jgi:hypothetical protein
MATKKTLLEKIFGAEKAEQVRASWRVETYSRYFKALDESNKEFLKTGKFKNSQELIDATNEFKLSEINEKRKRRLLINKRNASKPRKKDKPSKSELLSYKSKYAYDNGNARGWKSAAKIDFSLDAKTINKILE